MGSSVLSRLENGKPITSDKLFSILESLGLQMVVMPKRKFIEVQAQLEPDNPPDSNTVNSTDQNHRLAR